MNHNFANALSVLPFYHWTKESVEYYFVDKFTQKHSIWLVNTQGKLLAYETRKKIANAVAKFSYALAYSYEEVSDILYHRILGGIPPIDYFSEFNKLQKEIRGIINEAKETSCVTI